MADLKAQAPSTATGDAVVAETELEAMAKRHLLMHFTRHGQYDHGYLPIIARGEGCWLWDTHGRRYFDGLSGLFCVQVGYGFGAEIGAAVKAQMEQLPFYTNWSCAHPSAAKLAARVAALTPGDLNRVFFCNGGSEANEAAMKVARQHFALRGQPSRYKMLARRFAYHGTTWGALSLNGLTEIRAPFEPLMPGVRHLSNTDRFHRPADESEEQFTQHLLTEARQLIEFEGPESVACIFAEPVQNVGGSFVPPAGYFAGLRELCDEFGMLLVADEVICGFGRLGEWFGSERYGIEPDMIAFAKGIGSAYVPIGGIAVSDRVADVFYADDTILQHGSTYGGHPACCAAALANLDVMERERLLENVRDNEDHLRERLEGLYANPIVGDVRGAGYFMAVELVKDQEEKRGFNDEERAALLRGVLTPRLMDAGLICRAADYGEPVICLSPPLVANREDLDWMVDTIATVLDEIAPQVRTRA